MGFNWLDFTIVLIIVIICIDSMRRGLIYSFINLIGMFIALYVAKVFTPIVAKILLSITPVYSTLKTLFEKKVTSLGKGSISLLKLFNIKDSTIGEMLATILINLGCFILIFLLCYFFINIFRETIKGIINKTPIKYVDRLGGLIIGLIKSGILLFIFFAFVTPVIGLIPQNEGLVNAIGTSKLAKYFYMYNFIIPWMQRIIHK